MYKTFSLVTRGDIVSNGIGNTIQDKLLLNGFVMNNSHPDLVITVGGDGTMLEAFHIFSHCIASTSFVGIHTGHLGFYADWNQGELDGFIDAIINNSPIVVEYPLVSMIINDDNNITYKALNEITVKNFEKTFICKIFINGELFEEFRGDGLCISTPSGSTAYNKSLGGAVVHPTLEAIQISEISSINNKVFRTLGSSILLPKHHYVDIVFENRPEPDEGLIITMDHLKVLPPYFGKLSFRVSDSKVKFARYRKSTFWNRVKGSFIG